MAGGFAGCMAQEVAHLPAQPMVCGGMVKGQSRPSARGKRYRHLFKSREDTPQPCPTDSEGAVHSLARPSLGPDGGGNLSHPQNGDLGGGGEISSATVSGTGWGKWLGINRNKKGFA